MGKIKLEIMDFGQIETFISETYKSIKTLLEICKELPQWLKRIEDRLIDLDAARYTDNWIPLHVIVERWDVNDRMLKDAIRDGRLKAFRLNNKAYFVEKKDLKEFMEKNKIERLDKDKLS